MKRFVVILIVFLFVIGFFIAKFLYQPKKISSPEIPSNQSGVMPAQIPSSVLFVPYWTLNENVFPSSYSGVVYFGITANKDGINTQEEGYKNINQFIRETDSHQKIFLTVELLDQDVNEKILHDNAFQEKIISQSVTIAKQYGFDGIVLDLEYKALAFDEVVKGITNFSTNFASVSHKTHLSFYQALYGDTFYRLRPYDVQAIGKVANGIFILVYDFHKTNGNPGPNFPLYQLSDEQYSFVQMIQDFSSKVPVQKLSVVFGMFGYDWQVNDKGQSSQEASSITTSEAENKFSLCTLVQCVVARDGASSEMKATYLDKDKNKHEVWWEDMNSVKQKEDYMKSKGVANSSFWAWEYF